MEIKNRIRTERKDKAVVSILVETRVYGTVHYEVRKGLDYFSAKTYFHQ